MNILLSPLGLAPGTVTGAYYALLGQGYDIRSIITVSTSSDLTRLCEREIEAELERARRALNVNVTYQERLCIPNDEIQNATDVYRFRKLILTALQENLDAGHQVYLSLTGGRKSMVAAAAMAAQLRKPNKIFHVYVDEEIEREGHISSLLKKGTEKRWLYLNPPAGKISLVEIPFLSLDERGIDTSPWLGRIFEYAVGSYLVTQLTPPYTQLDHKFYPDYLHGKGLGEVDILAGRTDDGKDDLLLCECKMREEAVQTEWIERLARKRARVAEIRFPAAPERVKACLVTIAGTLEAPGMAERYGIEVYRAELPEKWRERADWEVAALQRLE